MARRARQPETDPVEPVLNDAPSPDTTGSVTPPHDGAPTAASGDATHEPEALEPRRFRIWHLAAAAVALVLLAGAGVAVYLAVRCPLSDDQQRVVEEFGFPRTFSITFGDREASPRLEAWEYYELGSVIYFRDGHVTGTAPIVALDPEKYAYPAISPEDFDSGMTVADISSLLVHGPESVEATAIPGADHRQWSGVVECGFTEGGLVAIRTTALRVGSDGAPLQVPVQGDVTITEAAAVWDVKGGPVDQVVPLEWAQSEGDVGWIATRLEALVEDMDFAAPVERAILEAKLRGSRLIVANADPGRTPAEVAPIAVQLVVEVESAETDRRSSGHEYANRYLERLYAGLGWVMPALEGEESSATDAGEGARGVAGDGRTVAVNRAPMTEGTWYVEAIVWKADGTVDPVSAPRQTFTTSDLLRYGDKLCQYWFERDGEFGHQHEALFGEGTYTSNGPMGDMTFTGELPMDETVRSASYYFDEADGTLYVVEHWIDKWDGKSYDRVLKMAR